MSHLSDTYLITERGAVVTGLPTNEQLSIQALCNLAEGAVELFIDLALGSQNTVVYVTLTDEEALHLAKCLTAAVNGRI